MKYEYSRLMNWISSTYCCLDKRIRTHFGNIDNISSVLSMLINRMSHLNCVQIQNVDFLWIFHWDIIIFLLIWTHFNQLIEVYIEVIEVNFWSQIYLLFASWLDKSISFTVSFRFLSIFIEWFTINTQTGA